MELKIAQEKAEELILHYGDYWEPLSMLARLTEESGELARAMNIKYGGKKAKNSDDGRAIQEELADVLFTVLAIANSQKIDLAQVFEEKIEKDFHKMKGVYHKK